MLSINIMLGIGQCGDGRCITHISLDTAVLLEWLHFGTDWPNLSGTHTGQLGEKILLADLLHLSRKANRFDKSL